MKQFFDQRSESSSPSSEPLKFPGGILIRKKNMVLEDYHRLALSKLQANEMGGLNFEPMNQNRTLWSLRWNGKGRILGMMAPNPITKKQAFFVVALYPNHELKQIKFVNVKELQHPVIDLKDSSAETKALDETIKSIESQAVAWEQTPYLNQQFIIFNDQQNQAIKVSLPRMVTGAAGSGKTLVIIQKLLEFLINHPQQKALYCAPTSHLVKEAQSLFNDLVAQHVEQLSDKDAKKIMASQKNIEFHTFESVVRANKKQEHMVDKAELAAWLALKQKEHPLLNTPAKRELIIQEFCIIASLPTASDYLTLAEPQCILEDKSERIICLKWYNRYLETHPIECQILFPTFKQDKQCYDLVVVDETQKFTLRQLHELLKCAQEQQILFCGDTLQSADIIPVISSLRQLLILDYKVKEPIVPLSTSFRCPKPVLLFTNELLKLRRQFGGGIVERWETIEMIAPEDGDENAYPVQWIDSLKATNTIQELTDLLQKPNVMLITGTEESAARAKQLFNDPFILLAGEAQGLEAETVVVFCPFTVQTMKEMNRKLSNMGLAKDNHHFAKKDQSNREFTKFFNDLFIAITRVRQAKGRLIIYLGEPSHDCANLFKALKAGIHPQLNVPQAQASQVKSLSEPHAVSPDNSQTKSKEEWIKWIRIIYKKDEDKAKAEFFKHVSRDEQEFEFYILPKKEPIKEQNSDARVVEKTKEITATAQSIPASTKQSQISPKLKKTGAAVTASSKKVQPVQVIKFTKAEEWMHQLLERCSLKNLMGLFDHKDVCGYLRTYYTQQNGMNDKMFFHSLIDHVTCLKTLLILIELNPFKIIPILDLDNITLEPILHTLNYLESTKGSKEHFNYLMTLLYKILHEQASTIHCLTEAQLKHLLNLIIPRLNSEDNIASRILHAISLQTPLSLYTVLKAEMTENTSHFIYWMNNLLLTQRGTAIIIHLYFAIPQNDFDLSTLQHFTNIFTPEGFSLFFWLSTTEQGNYLLQKIMIEYPQIAKVLDDETLLKRINHPLQMYNGTSMVFWMLSFVNKFKLVDWLIANNCKLVNLKEKIAQEVFAHPDYPQSSISGTALLEYSSAAGKKVKPMFIPAGFCSIQPNIEKNKSLIGPSDLIEHVISHQSANEIFKQSLKNLLDSPHAEDLLFDVPPGATRSLFFTLLLNDEYYDCFLDLLKQSSKYCKYFTIDRLKLEVIVNVDAVHFLIDYACKIPKNKQLLSILLANNPILIEQMQKENLLCSPESLEWKDKYIQINNLFHTLCSSLELVSCLDVLITPEQFNPKFMYEFFSHSFNMDKEITSSFELLLKNRPELVLSWFMKEPRFSQYLEVIYFYNTKPNNALKLLIANQHGMDFLDFILNARNDIFLQIPIELFLHQIEIDTNSFFHNLSATDSGAKFMMDLCRLKGFIHIVEHFNLDEMSMSPTSSNTTLGNLLKTDNGIDFLINLFKIHSFCKKFSPETLVSFENPTLSRFIKLCSTMKGLALLKIIIAEHPSCIKGLLQGVFYGLRVTHFQHSLLITLLKTCKNDPDKYLFIETLIEANPSLINKTAEELKKIPKTERLILALTIQLIQKSMSLEKETCVFLQEIIDELKSSKSTTVSVQPEIGVYCSNFLKCMASWKHEHLETLLRNLLMLKDVETKLHTPFLYYNEKVTVIEMLFKNSKYLKILVNLLSKDPFLTLGHMIDKGDFINSLFASLTTSTANQEDLLKLLRILVTQFPNILFYILSERYLSCHFLEILSTCETGQELLLAILKNRITMIKIPLERSDSKDKGDWLTPLFSSLIGCQIICLLLSRVEINILNYINIDALIKELKRNDNSCPIFFWLTVSHAGNLALNRLINKHPIILNYLTEHQLTRPIVSEHPNYNGTTMLFWLSKQEPELHILSKLKENKVLSSTCLNQPLLHPLLPNSSDSVCANQFVNYNRKIFKSHGTRPVFPVQPARDILHLNQGNFCIISSNEFDLYEETIRTLDNESTTRDQFHKIFNHPNAESILFDCIAGKYDSLFSKIALNAKVMNIFVAVLSEQDAYLKLFSVERLTQVCGEEKNNVLTVLLCILRYKPNFLLELMKINPELKKHFSHELFLGTMRASMDHNLLSVMCNDSQAAQAFNELDSTVYLTPYFVTCLYASRVNERAYFASICVNNPHVVIKWLEMEPRILFYFPEHILVESEHSNSQQGGNKFKLFHHLSSTKKGIEILKLIIKIKPELFKNLSMEQLTHCTKEKNSIFYNLRNIDGGLSFLNSLFKVLPAHLKHRILPSHLDEKRVSNISSKSPSSMQVNAFFKSLEDEEVNTAVKAEAILK